MIRSDKFEWLAVDQSRTVHGTLWSLLIAGIGVSLWAQVFYLPLVDEVRFANPSLWVMAAYLAPTVALLGGVVWRAAWLTLLVFFISFVPGVFLLSSTSLLQAEAPWSLARIGVTLAAYIATASAGAGPVQLVVGRASSAAQAAHGSPRAIQHIPGVYRLYFALRGLILFGLLLVIQYAVFRDAHIAHALAQSYPGRPEAAATFIGVFSFFAWCVAAYSLFFVPLMNLEYDVRTLSLGVDQMLQAGARAHRRRAVVWLGAAALLVGLLGWLLGFGL